MKNKGKVLALTLSAAALVAASVFGTMAYLTDADTVTNTFTVGKVGLTLDEAIVNTAGQPLKDNEVVEKVEDADRTNETKAGNAYHLLPGHTYVKDPTVTIDANSEESYVRMMVEVTFIDSLTDAELATSLDTIFTGYDSTKWIRSDKTVSEDKKVINYEYRYFKTVDGTAEELEPLFTAITVPGEYDNEQIAFLQDMRIVINAHAIQADGFADADTAWTAFGEQINN